MNISEIFIRRPIMTSLVMIGILLFGLMAYKSLPVSDLPKVDFPFIMVTAGLPGANPETMASAVATPLERQFSTIAGIESMSSSSVLGQCVIILQFALDRNIDAAAQDVQSAISQTLGKLPQDMPSPPSYLKINPVDQPILYVALTSASLPMSKVDEYGETTMAQRISTISGVAQVQVLGATKYAVRIQLDPQELASRGLGVDEITQAIRSGNVNLPTGVLYGKYQAYTINTKGQLMDADAYRPLVVAYRHNSPVRLGEIGKVFDSIEFDKSAAWFVSEGKRESAVVLAVYRQPGTNTVEVADAVKALLPVFQKQLPPSVNMHMMFDRSVSIHESVMDVQGTLLLTLMLVVMVIFLFLRSFRATLIPSLALPMAIMGTFVCMYMMNYSLDNLSLMALTLSVGFVVDDAIVMLENIVRHMEMGKSRWQATLDGSKEIAFTIISMTLSLAAVFIPVIFMPGLVGRLFREFSVTIGAAVLVSGFVSLTLTPMLSARFLRNEHTVRHGWFYDVVEKGFQILVGFYGRTLRIVLEHKRITLAISFVILIGTGYLFTLVPKGFLPSEDRGMLFAQCEAAEGISYDALAGHQMELASVLDQEPAIESYFITAGSGPMGGSSNKGFVFMRLKPRDQRTITADQLVEKLRDQVSAVPGLKVFLQNPPPIQTSGRMSAGQYQYTLQGSDIAEVYDSAQKLEEKFKVTPGLVDVGSDLQIKNPQVNVKILRDTAATLGVTANHIEDALFGAYGSRQISTIYTLQNQYKVVMELLPRYQTDPDIMSLLYVRSSTGQLVPLKAVTQLERGLGLLSVNHTGQLPSVTLSYNLKAGTSLGEGTAAATKAGAEILPRTVTGGVQGSAKLFLGSMSSMVVLLFVAIAVIYMVLGILYESWIHPLTILTALPFAGFGALLTLLIFHVELSLYGFVGIIMLIGLVKKNGIMMVDFAIEAQHQGKSPHDAIYEACLARFRPIAMTTMAALMAGIPLAIGYGAGGEARRPLGLAIVGGLIFSQTLTLYVTPVFFLVMEWLAGRRREKFAAVSGDGMLAPAPIPTVEKNP